MLPGMAPIIAGSAGSARSLVFVANTVNTGNASTYTFSSHAIGTAGATRRLIVGAYGFRNSSNIGDVNSITVGGDSTTDIVTSYRNYDDDQTGRMAVSLRRIDVAAGTTADIVVSFGQTYNCCGIAVWAVYDHDSSIISTADNGGRAVASTALTLTGSLTDSSFIGFIGGTAGLRTVTWAPSVSGSVSGTEDFDATVEDVTGTTQDTYYSGYSGEITSASGDLTLTATPSSTSTIQAVGVALR